MISGWFAAQIGDDGVGIEDGHLRCRGAESSARRAARRAAPLSGP
jgi:hypothetical protein